MILAESAATGSLSTGLFQTLVAGKTGQPAIRGGAADAPASARSARLRAARANMEEERQTAPQRPVPRRAGRDLVLAQGLDDEPRVLEGAEVRLDRPVLAHECHLEPVALEAVDVAERVEVRALDHERRVVGVGLAEAARRVERMDDGEHEAAAGLEHARARGTRRDGRRSPAGS